MPKHEYDWKIGSPAVLGPHSLAKHTILREYIEQYIYILTRSGTLPDLRVMLIDGFAGGGEYVVEGQGSKIHDGSPIVLIQAVAAAKARINTAERKRPIVIDADFVFVEKKKSNFLYLKDMIERRFEKKMVDESVRLIHGAFEDHLESIIKTIKSCSGRKPRPIFVLDQYGWSHVPIDMIARIMNELPSSEIFLTFAVDWISAYAGSLSDALGKMQKSLHIDPRLEDFVNGRREMEEISQMPEDDRNSLMLDVQRLLHDAFATQSRARCYTPFFITSRGSHRSYWFLHLANNARANDAVKELHWKVNNHFKHYGREGTKQLMLGYDPDRRQIAFDFGDSAKVRTVEALMEELPRLIRDKYSQGISFNDLYSDLCNETPASKEMLRGPINNLCGDGELEKSGAEGEKRHLMTKVNDMDIIRPAKQGRLFFPPDKKR